VSRPLALIVGIALTLATLSPSLRSAPFADDSYPFSTYPMFARTMTKRVIVFAEGTGTPSPKRLGPELVANDEPMQAQRTLSNAAKSGTPALRVLCARIAERVASSTELKDVRRVRIVRALFDPVRYFEVAAEPEQREVLSQCRVRRAP
jgi:hypothetical protein